MSQKILTKTWATALGALTLRRWAHDLAAARVTLRRLPTRAELIARLGGGIELVPTISQRIGVTSEMGGRSAPSSHGLASSG
jgi:hypothetical protein